MGVEIRIGKTVVSSVYLDTKQPFSLSFEPRISPCPWAFLKFNRWDVYHRHHLATWVYLSENQPFFFVVLFCFWNYCCQSSRCLQLHKRRIMKIKPLRPRPILLITHRDQLKSVFPHPITVFREQMAMSDKGRDSFVHLSLSLHSFSSRVITSWLKLPQMNMNVPVFPSSIPWLISAFSYTHLIPLLSSSNLAPLSD